MGALHPPTEPTTTTSSSSSSSPLLDEVEATYTSLIQQYLGLLCYDNAIFYAERLVAHSKTLHSTHLLAMCYYRNRELHRARSVLMMMMQSSSDAGGGLYEGHRAPYVHGSTNRGTSNSSSSNNRQAPAASRYLLAKVCYELHLYTEAEQSLLTSTTSSSLEQSIQDILQTHPCPIPNGAAGLALLGDVCRQSQRRKRAALCYRLALALDPMMWTAFQGLAELGVEVEVKEIFGVAPGSTAAGDEGDGEGGGQGEESLLYSQESGSVGGGTTSPWSQSRAANAAAATGGKNATVPAHNYNHHHHQTQEESSFLASMSFTSPTEGRTTTTTNSRTHNQTKSHTTRPNTNHHPTTTTTTTPRSSTVWHGPSTNGGGCPSAIRTAVDAAPLLFHTPNLTPIPSVQEDRSMLDTNGPSQSQLQLQLPSQQQGQVPPPPPPPPSTGMSRSHGTTAASSSFVSSLPASAFLPRSSTNRALRSAQAVAARLVYETSPEARPPYTSSVAAEYYGEEMGRRTPQKGRRHLMSSITLGEEEAKDSTSTAAAGGSSRGYGEARADDPGGPVASDYSHPDETYHPHAASATDGRMRKLLTQEDAPLHETTTPAGVNRAELRTRPSLFSVESVEEGHAKKKHVLAVSANGDPAASVVGLGLQTSFVSPPAVGGGGGGGPPLSPSSSLGSSFHRGGVGKRVLFQSSTKRPQQQSQQQQQPLLRHSLSAPSMGASSSNGDKRGGGRMEGEHGGGYRSRLGQNGSFPSGTHGGNNYDGKSGVGNTMEGGRSSQPRRPQQQQQQQQQQQPQQQAQHHTEEKEEEKNLRGRGGTTEYKGVQSILTLLSALGTAYQHLCQYRCQEALSSFLTLIPTAHYETGWVQHQVGRAYFEMADYTNATKALETMQTLEPHRLEGLEVLSTTLWHLKKEIELCNLAQRVVEMNRQSAVCWCVVGNCFSLQRDHETALVFFKRSIQLDANFTYSHTLSGHEYVSNEDFDKAVHCFRNAIRVDDRHYNAWYGLGSIYFRQEKYDLAEYHFRRALTINPQSSVLHCHLGMVQHANAKPYEAFQTLQHAVALEPCNPHAWYQKATILMSLHRYEEALTELEKVRDAAPRESSVHFTMGKVCKKLGRTEDAMRCFLTALDLDPKDNNVIKAAIDRLDEPDIDEDVSAF